MFWILLAGKYCAPIVTESRPPSMDQGNPECWVAGFSYELCCSSHYGEKGNDVCWDGLFDFDRCCHAPGKPEL